MVGKTKITIILEIKLIPNYKFFSVPLIKFEINQYHAQYFTILTNVKHQDMNLENIKKPIQELIY